MKIFLATWMESVTTIILAILLKFVAWLMLHLIANSSASVLVMRTVWWIVFVRGLLYICMYTIDVAILFLMLTSEAMMATEGMKRTPRPFCQVDRCEIYRFYLCYRHWNEIQSEKLSITLSPGENSKSRGAKDEKHSLDLLVMSTKWPLTSEHYQLVSESRAIDLRFGGVLSCKSIREHTRWLGGSL